MPAPAAALAAIGAGSQLASTALNYFSTRSENKKSRRFSREMYDRQFQDNIAFWNMQNEYNSPSRQMQRFKQAGLNPNLLYGGSVTGAAGNADKISTPDVQSAQFRVPDFSGVQGAGLTMMNAIYDLQIKQAQVNNLEADNTVKYANAALTLANTKRSKFDLQFETDLRDINANILAEILRNKSVTADFTISENERKSAMNASNLKEAAARILRMRRQNARDKAEIRKIGVQIKNLKYDNILKEMDANWRRQGLTQSDPLYWRMLGTWLNSTSLFNK